MTEYVLVFFFLLVGSLAVYFVYDRYVRRPPMPSAGMYVEALRDLLNNRQEAAFTKLRQVVADDSNNIDAYLRLGQILREHKRPDRALQVHKDLTMRSGLTLEFKSEILKQLYRDYLALDDYATAESALKEWVTLEPSNRDPHIFLLRLYEKQKRWEEAYDAAAAVLKLEGFKTKKPLARYKYQMGRRLHKEREYHKARVLYKEALGLDPSLVDAYLAIGDSYVSEDRAEDAVNIWKKLISEVPESGHLAIARLKRTLFDLGRFGDIMDICREILRHSPANLQARLALADFYYKKGDLDSADEILSESVSDNPENLEVMLQQLRLLHEKGDRRKIDELFRRLERQREKASKDDVEPLSDSSKIAVS